MRNPPAYERGSIDVKTGNDAGLRAVAFAKRGQCDAALSELVWAAWREGRASVHMGIDRATSETSRIQRAFRVVQGACVRGSR